MKHIKIPTLLLFMTAMYSCKKDKKTDPVEPDPEIIDVMDNAFLFSQAYQLSPPDTIYKEITRMTEANLNVIVPAGSFSTLNAQHVYFFNPKYSSIPVRYRNVRYAGNVGIITETAPFYMSANTYTERRLVRYHLN
jgi:hypothetical protein